jgi:hypothetical protein
MNPVITETSPADSSFFLYGDVIDLTATYQVLNGEDQDALTYGWDVVRVTGNIDISDDIVKTYFNTSMLRVHLD